MVRAMALPMAHIGHYLWVFYLVPVLVVVGGIVRTTILERRRKGGERK
jgi:heme exporter protein D